MPRKTGQIIEAGNSEPFSRTLFTIPEVRVYGENFTGLTAIEHQTVSAIRYLDFRSTSGNLTDVRWGSDILQDLADKAYYPKSREGIPLSKGWELMFFSGGEAPTSFLVQTKNRGGSYHKMSYEYLPQPEAISGFYHFAEKKLGKTVQFHCFPKEGINDLVVITGQDSDKIDIHFEGGIFTKVVIGSRLLSRLIPGFSNLPILIDRPVVHRDQLSLEQLGIVELKAEQISDYSVVVEAIEEILGERVAELGEVNVLETIGSLCQNIEKESPVKPTDCIHYFTY